MTAAKHEFLERVGAQLRAVRTAQGRTQEQVAERAGFSGKYLSEIERGRRDVPLSTLVRLAEVGLGVGVAVVLDGEPVARDARPLPASVREFAEDVAQLPPSVRRSLGQLAHDLVGAMGPAFSSRT